MIQIFQMGNCNRLFGIVGIEDKMDRNHFQERTVEIPVAVLTGKIVRSSTS